MALKAAIEVWGIPSCGTTRKAVKFLEGEGLTFDYRNVRETVVPKALIREMLKVVDNPRKVFNTSGGSYKDGGWKDKVAGMSNEEIVSALVADPMLIKRPVVRTPKGMVVGFDEDSMRRIL
ncbi:MAG: Spx/MgsR family RNA polymerase-binding regulatory protein [Bacteroidia bacterium]|nr:Spx/MgsR family RNA polymerase-binding regulatory protein [Bacteroidia bacterium]